MLPRKKFAVTENICVNSKKPSCVIRPTGYGRTTGGNLPKPTHRHEENFGNHTQLERSEIVRAISSFRTATFLSDDCEVIVADNGSVDDSVSFLETQYPMVPLIVFDKTMVLPKGTTRPSKRWIQNMSFY